jgi:hypothetical protein
MATATDFGIDFSHIGPNVGERFPDVVLPDQHGEMLNLLKTGDHIERPRRQ